MPVQRAVVKPAEPKTRRWDRVFRSGLSRSDSALELAVIDAYEWVVDAFSSRARARRLGAGCDYRRAWRRRAGDRP